MRILMLVATSVATDTRVLREAATLVDAGHAVHIIGKSVPTDFTPPPGVTVGSVGSSSVFRKGGGASLARRRPPPHVRLARWALLPQHRNSAFTRWASDAEHQAQALAFDVVHAHDYTALEVGDRLARQRGIPLVYDTHELWSGRPREYRPTPLQDRAERRTEQHLGARAAAVITVGEGVADSLRASYGWKHVEVVRNTFPLAAQTTARSARAAPTGLVYAGRLAAYRELETIAEASRFVDLPIELVGPADETWLAAFDPGRATVSPACSVDEVARKLAAAGLALVTHSDRWENHRLALPNKLFHAIHAGVPVVATDVGELARIVRAHGVGTLYRPGDAADLARAVGRAVADYPSLLRAVDVSAAALSWEHDASVLRGVYRGLSARADST